MAGPLVSRLTDLLDGRWGWARAEARELLRAALFAPVHGLSTEQHRARVAKQMAELARRGLTSAGFPERYGGLGDVGAFVTGFETLACGDLSLLVKCGVQWGLFAGALLHLGTEEHHQRYLRPAIKLDLPGCFAMTESGHGSDVQSLRTTATYIPADRCFVIDTPDDDARKDYIGNAARDGRMAVVFAQLIAGGQSHGVHALVVPIRDERGRPYPGVKIEDCGDKAGLNGVDNGRLYFHAVRVPRTALLNRYGDVQEDGRYISAIDNPSRRFFTMIGTLVQGRVSVAGAALSAAKTALTIAVRHGLSRRQFRAPGGENEVILLDYRQHQRRLLPSLAKTYALHCAQAELVAALDDASRADAPSADRRRLEGLAAGIKALSTWHTTATVQACREACGGWGYLAESRLPALKADTDVFTTFEGDNTVLMQLVAKGLLTDYRDEFESLDVLSTLRAVAEGVVERVLERSGAQALLNTLIDAVPGREDEADLFDRDYHLGLLAWRERHVLDGVARRLRAGLKGDDAFEAFNRCQDHLLLAARAHVERVLLEAFARAVQACDDTEVAALLDEVCDLFVLSLIESERAWFLEHRRLTPTRAKAVINAVNELCARIRPQAGLLVEAFAIPDEMLISSPAG